MKRDDVSELWNLGNDMDAVTEQIGKVKSPEKDYLLQVEATGEMGNPDDFFRALSEYHGTRDLPDRAIGALDLSALDIGILIRGCREYYAYGGGNQFATEVYKRRLTIGQIEELRKKGQVSAGFDRWADRLCHEALTGKRMDYHSYERYFINGICKDCWLEQIPYVDPETAFTTIRETVEFDGEHYENEYTVRTYPFKQFISEGRLDILQTWAEGRLTPEVLRDHPASSIRISKNWGWAGKVLERYLDGDRTEPTLRVLEAIAHARVCCDLAEKAAGIIDLGSMTLNELAYASMKFDLRYGLGPRLEEEIRSRCSPGNDFESALFRFLYPHSRNIRDYQEAGNRSICWEFDRLPEDAAISKTSEHPEASIEGLEESYGPYMNKAGSR